MRSSLKSPQSLFFIGVLALVLIGFISRDQTIDIHLHDTYYVIGLSMYYWMFAVFFLALSIIYSFGKNLMLSSKLSMVHLILSFACIICIHIIANNSFTQSLFLNLNSYSRFNRTPARPVIGLFLLAQ